MSSRALIVKVKKDENGNITDVMLNNGSIYSINEALTMSMQGLVEHIIVKRSKDGTEYYRDNPTTLGDDSFNHLPEF